MAGTKKDIYIDQENLKWLQQKAEETGKRISGLVNELILRERVKEEMTQEKPKTP